MRKCEVCGDKESFRVLKNLHMCIFCYGNNLSNEKGKYVKEIKATIADFNGGTKALGNSTYSKYVIRNNKRVVVGHIAK